MTNDKESKIKEKLGVLIKRSRKSYGYSQEEFGFLIGLSAKSISNIENGIYLPSISTAAQIQAILKIDCLDIIMKCSNDPKLNLYFSIREFYRSFLTNDWYKASINLNKFHTVFEQYIDYAPAIHKKFYFIMKSFKNILNFAIDKSWHYICRAEETLIEGSKLDLHLNMELERLKLIVRPLFENSTAADIKSSAIESINLLADLATDSKVYVKIKYFTKKVLELAYIYGPFERISCKKSWQGCMPCKALLYNKPTNF